MTLVLLNLRNAQRILREIPSDVERPKLMRAAREVSIILENEYSRALLEKGHPVHRSLEDAADWASIACAGKGVRKARIMEALKRSEKDLAKYISFLEVSILKEALALGELPHEDDRESRKDKYEALSNPIQAFINDECEIDCDAAAPLWYLFKKFDEYRTMKGHRKFTDREFYKALHGMGFETKQKWFNPDEQAAFKDVTPSSGGQNWRAVYGIQLNLNDSNDSNTLPTQYSPCNTQLTTPLESLESFKNTEYKEKEVQSLVVTPEEAAALAIEEGL